MKNRNGEVCQAMWSHGSTCENNPDHELTVNGLKNGKPFILCTNHCKPAETVLQSLGVFYKVRDHDYPGKQGKLF